MTDDEKIEILKKIELAGVTGAGQKLLADVMESTISSLQIEMKRQTEEIVLQLLGFKRYGQSFNLDLYKHSPIANELKPIFEHHAKEMVKSLSDDFDFSESPISKTAQAEAMRDLRKGYKETFIVSLQEEMHRVKSRAKVKAMEMFPLIVQQQFGKSIEDIEAEMITHALMDLSAAEARNEEVKEVENLDDVVQQMQKYINYLEKQLHEKDFVVTRR